MADKNFDDSFFNNLQSKNKKHVGVPHIQMNKAIVDNSLLKGHIGLELEVEGRNLPSQGSLESIVSSTLSRTWQAKRDGSLRGPEALEYVLDSPIFLGEVDGMVSGLWEKFQLNNTVLENSNRCSTHVHININGKKINELTSIIGLWMTFEEVLINWCGENRIRNHHCLSSKDCNSVINAWRGLLHTGNTRFNDGLKYSALNILTIFSFGSLEFRCGMAPNNPKQVASWAKFLYNFVEYASNTYKNPQTIANDLSERGALQILQEICETSQDLQFFKEVIEGVEGSFDQICMEGFRNAQPFILGFPWNEWLPEIEKQYIPDPFSYKKKEKYLDDRLVEIEDPRQPLAPPTPVEWERLREETYRNMGTNVRNGVF